MEVREQRAIARLLPAQPIPEACRLDRDEDEAGLSGAMASRALGDLGCGREVDEAVAPIVFRAGVAARGDRLFPCLGRAHVVDHWGHATSLLRPSRRAKPAALLSLR